MRSFLLLLFSFPFLLNAQSARLFERADSLSAEGNALGAIRQLEQLIQDYPKRDHDRSVAYLTMSGLYLRIGDYLAALQANRRSKEIRDQMRSDDIAENYARFGEIYLSLGRYERALSYLERARELPFLFPELFASVNALTAEAFRGLDQPEKAFNYYDKAINLLEIEFGSEDPILQPYLLNAGRTALAAGQPAVAVRYFERALQEGEPSAKHYQLLGLAALAADRRVEARDQLMTALRRYEAEPDAPRVALAGTELALARLSMAEGMEADRQTYLFRAIRTLCPRFESDDFLENPRPRELILDRLLLAEALAGKAELLLERGDAASLAAAVETVLAGADILDFFITYADQEQLRWDEARTRALPLYEAGIAAAVRHYRQSGEATFQSRAFELAERARHWEWRLHQLLVLQEGPFEQVLEGEQFVRRWLTDAKAALGRNPGQEPLWIQVNQRQGTLDQRIEQYRTEEPRIYRWLYDRRTARSRDVAALLGPQTLHLSYFVGPRQTFLFAIDREGLSIEEWAVGADSLAVLVQELTGSLHRREARRLVETGQALYQRLLAPFDRQLRKKDELVIVPHGPLYHLPFGLLPERSAGQRIRHDKLRYLGAEYALYLAPTATLWKRWQEQPVEEPPLSFTGLAPEFGPENNELPASYQYAFDTVYQHSRGLRAAAPGGRRLAPRSAATSLETIAQVLQLDRTQVRTGPAAGEESLRQQIGGSRFLHLFAPAYADPSTPSLTGLALSGAGLLARTDGLVWSSDLLVFDFKGGRVALDGFVSGPPGTGMPGSWYALGASFVDAGARSALGTTGTTEPVEVTFWMAYYRFIRRGMGEAQAVRAAVEALLDEEETAPPWHWGRYLLMGAGQGARS